MRIYIRRPARSFVSFLGLAVGLATPALAQDDAVGRITAASAPADQPIVMADSDSPVSAGSMRGGTYKLAGDAQLMATIGADAAVLVATGPAEFSIKASDKGTAINIASGTVLISAAAGGDGNLFVAGGGSANPVQIERIAAGEIIELRISGTGSTVALVSGTPASRVNVRAADKAETLQLGEAVTLAGGAVTRSVINAYAPLDAERLSLLPAGTLRTAVDESLFEEIVGWDRFAGAGEVQKNLPPSRTNPEVRQVAVTVNTVNAVPARAGVATPAGLRGANQVPIISPASLVVQAGADGAFTVVSNNRLAELNLTLTGSQGLGFGGSSLLSIQGIIGGFRSIGPAGLGGR